MQGHRIGYKRVSTQDQNTTRQLDGVALYKVFEDHCSGKNMDRPQLTLCREFLREGDTLVVHSMDRLARNNREFQDLVAELTDHGIKIEFVKENLTVTDKKGDISSLLLAVFGWFAEFELENIHERQAQGIAIAKAAGKYKGRKRQLTPEQADELRHRVESRAAGESVRSIAREYGFTPQTLYSYLKVKPDTPKEDAA